MRKFAKHTSLILLGLFLCSCSNGAPIRYETKDYIKELQWKENFLVCHFGDLHISGLTNFNYEFEWYKKVVYSNSNQKPDLIILNGDVFMNANKEGVRRTFEFFDSLDIPYVFNYGNHDLEGSYSPEFIEKTIANSRNCLNPSTPNDDVYGRSNFLINLVDNDDLKYQIFIMDSNSYKYDNYDDIHQDQIDWYERMLLDTHGYTQAPDVIDENTFTKSLFFCHIPPREFRTARDNFKDNNPGVRVLGDNFFDGREGIGHGNNETQLLNVLSKYQATTMIASNHDHENIFDLWYNHNQSSWPIRFIYGLKAGYSCYYADDLIGGTFYTLFENPKLSTHGNNLYFKDSMIYVPYEGEASVLWENSLA